MTTQTMTAAELAAEFTVVLKAGQYEKAEDFWADDIVSIEAQDGPMQRETRGRAAVHAKGEWWVAHHDIHRFDTHGPYANGDRFALRFSVDVTVKDSGERRVMDEVGLYTVRDGKIVEERFFY